MEIDATTVSGQPFFVIPYRSALRLGYERIRGYARLNEYAAFPAYPPFGTTVANDIRLVFPDAGWTSSALDTLKETQLKIDKVEEDSLELPEDIKDLDFTLQPFDHQREALRFSYLYPRTALLLDCGLGKTKVTIDLIRACKMAGEKVHAIVLCPSGLIVINWAREVALYGPELSIATTSTASGNLVAKTRREKLYAAMQDDPPDIFVTSYGCLVNDKDKIKAAFKHTMLVCDESHYLQTPTSKRTKAVRALATCPRRLLLSGTASQGSPVHLFGQIAVLAPYLVGDLWKFKNKFLTMVDGVMCRRCNRRYEEMPKIKKCWTCNVADFRRIQIVKGFKNLHVLSKIVSIVALRKSAEECLDLPPLRTIDVPYGVNNNTRKIYNEMVEGTATELLAGAKDATPMAAQKILRLLQILAGFMPDAEGTIHRFDNALRLQTITDLLEAIFASADSKVIIWGHFIESMNIVAELLEKLGVDYVRVDGSVKHRETLREKFETDPECKVYLGQVQTGIGINLVAANYVIYADLPFFSWSHYKQSLKRAHRIGQTRAVTVYRLYAEGSLHEYVLHVLDSKDSIVQSLVNRNLCSLCSDARKCADAGIKPFDAACSLAKSKIKNRKARLAQL